MMPTRGTLTILAIGKQSIQDDSRQDDQELPRQISSMVWRSWEGNHFLLHLHHVWPTTQLCSKSMRRSSQLRRWWWNVKRTQSYTGRYSMMTMLSSQHKLHIELWRILGMQMKERRMSVRYVHDCWRTITRPTGTWTRFQRMTWQIWYSWFPNPTGHGEEKLSLTSESRRFPFNLTVIPRSSRRRVKCYLRICDLFFFDLLSYMTTLTLVVLPVVVSLLHWDHRVTDGFGVSAQSCTYGAWLKVHVKCTGIFSFERMLMIHASWKERSYHRTISRLIHDTLWDLTIKFLHWSRTIIDSCRNDCTLHVSPFLGIWREFNRSPLMRCLSLSNLTSHGDANVSLHPICDLMRHAVWTRCFLDIGSF